MRLGLHIMHGGVPKDTDFLLFPITSAVLLYLGVVFGCYSENLCCFCWKKVIVLMPYALEAVKQLMLRGANEVKLTSHTFQRSYALFHLLGVIYLYWQCFEQVLI